MVMKQANHQLEQVLSQWMPCVDSSMNPECTKLSLTVRFGEYTAI
jgi:hypothetical protein